MCLGEKMEEQTIKNYFDNLVYLSIRESDAAFAGYKKSVSIFGSGENGNIALNKITGKRYNHNDEKNFDFLDDFFISNIKNLHKQNKNLKFVYYNKHRVIFLPKSVQKLIAHQPPTKILNFWDNKFESRKFVGEFLPVLEYYFKKGKTISYNSCQKLFRNAKRFVVQAKHSIGGAQTFLLTKNNEQKVIASLDPKTTYAISEYKENNIAINVHFVIAKNSICILPASMQLIETQNDTMEYIGCDFSIFSQVLSEKTQKKVVRFTTLLAKKMMEQGYLGVAGVDFIVCDDEVYFMEVNPRFQSSTNVLNLALKENNLPSVNELDAMAFVQKTLPRIPNIFVNYSKICTTQDQKNCLKQKPYIVLSDGYNNKEEAEEGAYFETLIYKGSIKKLIK